MNFGGLRLPTSGLDFNSALPIAAWAALVGVPVGIIALYFLKLRRRPVQVPSTLLWRRSLEDLHVNSLFQRLRKNLLLFLQLLAVALVMLALAGPRIGGTAGEGRRFVLAIDQSASMAATDVEPSRIEKAKEEAKKLVDSMEANDLAMVIAFSDRARVISNYTGNRGNLRSRIDSIQPTEAATSLREALELAAGLANPSKVIEGVAATSIVAPTLMIYTDGGFADVSGFSLDNLKPEVVVIGSPPGPITPPKVGDGPPADPATRQAPRAVPSNNLAIAALSARRNDEKPDVYQLYGRVRNYRNSDTEVEAKLLRHDPEKPGADPALIDAIALKVPAQSDQSFKFDLPDSAAKEVEVRLVIDDDLALDNRAYALVGDTRRSRVLCVTTGNRYLVDTLKTTLAEQRAEVTVVGPDEAKADPIARDTAAGAYDLVIYDRFRPANPPESNTLYFGALPPGPAFANSKVVEGPVILDWDVAHPMMQYIRDLATVRVAKAISVEPPPGSAVLIEGNGGPLAFVTPRSGFSDAVVTFALVEGKDFNTDWPFKISFPLFLFNVMHTLGNVGEGGSEEAHAPGQSVIVRAEAQDEAVTLSGPKGGRGVALKKTPQGTYLANATDTTGLYHAKWEPNGSSAFAVNQFDPRESDLSVRGMAPAGVEGAAAESYKIKIGFNPVEVGTPAALKTRRELWAYVAALALVIVLVEWYIYNRRVYI